MRMPSSPVPTFTVMGSTVKGMLLGAVPPGVVSTNGPVWAVAGTVNVSVVAFTTVKPGTAAPFSVRAVAPVKPVPVTVTTVPYDSHAYRQPPPTTKRGQLNLAGFITQISEDPARDGVIVAAVTEQAHAGHRVLVLSDRRAHCQALADKCVQSGLDCGLYLGGMKQAELQQVEACQVLVSTYPLVSEGYDNPRLSCLVLATPRSDVHQATGRVLRMTPGKTCDPAIVDIRDNSPVFHAQYQKRKRFYTSQGFRLTGREEHLPSFNFRQDV